VRSFRNAPYTGAASRRLRPLTDGAPALLASALAVLLGAAALTGCGQKKEARLTGRLWVTELPTNPQQRVGAMVFTEVGGRRLGVLHQGSAYRSQHEAVQWVGGDERGELVMLQDGRKHAVKVETCTPTRGFDLCVKLVGDPLGYERYQSRKRWSIKPRVASGGESEAGVIAEIAASVAEIAAEDTDVAPLAEAL
jgi:hypothetical protein